jgi:very-short-patch-repair endonuclease
VALAALAAAQHGVVTLDQLRRLGLSDRATRDRAGARRRDQRLILAGWTVVRTTWRQVLRRPEEVADVVVPLLRR